MPRPPRWRLCPYTTLFRSLGKAGLDEAIANYQASLVPEMPVAERSEEHTSELQSRGHLVCRLLLEKKNSLSYNLHHPPVLTPTNTPAVLVLTQECAIFTTV